MVKATKKDRKSPLMTNTLTSTVPSLKGNKKNEKSDPNSQPKGGKNPSASGNFEVNNVEKKSGNNNRNNKSNNNKGAKNTEKTEVKLAANGKQVGVCWDCGLPGEKRGHEGCSKTLAEANVSANPKTAKEAQAYNQGLRDAKAQIKKAQNVINDAKQGAKQVHFAESNEAIISPFEMIQFNTHRVNYIGLTEQQIIDLEASLAAMSEDNRNQARQALINQHIIEEIEVEEEEESSHYGTPSYTPGNTPDSRDYYERQRVSMP
jgi:hypothetical protein